jgi:prepilin-type N-terminal cleavage/methylation domain-containing protein
LKKNRGFTLIEILIAAAILACSLVAAAAVFSFAIRTNGMNRQMALATVLLCEKMEDFRAAPFSDPMWTHGNGSETLVRARDQFTRSWNIEGNAPRRVTVVVYAESNALTRRRTELIRATTLVSPTF